VTLNRNTAESGLATGTAVTTANSAFPNAWTSVTGSGITFDSTTPGGGSLGYKFVAASSTNTYVEWLNVAGATNAAAIEFDLYLPSLPVTNAQPVAHVRSAGGGAGLVTMQVNTSGQVFFSSDANAGTVVGTTTGSLTAATHYRVSIQLTNATTTTGTIALNVYTPASSTTPVSGLSLSLSGINIGTSTLGTFRFGRPGAIGTAYTVYLDSISAQTGSSTAIGYLSDIVQVTTSGSLSGSGTLSATVTPALTRSAAVSGSGTLAASTTWAGTAGSPGGITKVGSTTFASPGNVTTVTLTRPTGVQAGDLLLGFAAGATSSVPAVPTGWTAWDPAVSYGPNLNVIYKIADSADPATWDWTVASQKWAGGVVAYRGVDTTTPKDVASVTASSTTGWPTVPAITTASANALVLAIGGVIGPSGDTDITWTTDGTLDASATATAPATTDPAAAVTSRARAAAGAFTPSLAPVETVSRGGVLVTALRAAQPSLPLSGTGTLTASTSIPQTASVDLSGAGQLSATSTPKLTLNVDLAGAGGLAARLSATSVTAQLTGTGTLTATVSRDSVVVAVALSSNGVLTAQARPIYTLSVDLSGSGELTAVSAKKHPKLYPGQLTFPEGVTYPGLATDMSREYRFSTPTIEVRARAAGRALWITAPWGLSVWRINGVWHSGASPSAEIRATADRFYLGGVAHVINVRQRAELIAAGFGDSITPLGGTA
jgi:hypothetical protein